MSPSSLQKVRADRWLWAARFFKTRSLAKTAIEGGKVQFLSETNKSSRIKPATEFTIGDTLQIRRGEMVQTITIDGLSEKRGSAPIAQQLYTETPDSIEQRESARALKRMHNAGLKVPQTRPSKKDRREIQKLKQSGAE